MLAEAIAGWSERYPDVPVRRRVAYGAPARMLVEESAAAQLTVVGARGRGALAGMLLGSVSHAVLHHAHSPLVIVRHRREDRKRLTPPPRSAPAVPPRPARPRAVPVTAPGRRVRSARCRRVRHPCGATADNDLTDQGVPMNRPVVVGVDGSPSSLVAAEHAARRRRAPVPPVAPGARLPASVRLRRAAQPVRPRGAGALRGGAEDVGAHGGRADRALARPRRRGRARSPAGRAPPWSRSPAGPSWSWWAAVASAGSPGCCSARSARRWPRTRTARCWWSARTSSRSRWTARCWSAWTGRSRPDSPSGSAPTRRRRGTSPLVLVHVEPPDGDRPVPEEIEEAQAAYQAEAVGCWPTPAAAVRAEHPGLVVREHPVRARRRGPGAHRGQRRRRRCWSWAPGAGAGSPGCCSARSARRRSSTRTARCWSPTRSSRDRWAGRVGPSRPASTAAKSVVRANGSAGPVAGGRRSTWSASSPAGAVDPGAQRAVGGAAGPVLRRGEDRGRHDHRPQVGEQRPQRVLQRQRVPGGAAGGGDQHRLVGQRRRRRARRRTT